MPADLDLDRDWRIIRMTLTGTLSGAEMLAAIDEAVQRIGGDAGYRVLSDHRDLAAPATPEQVRAVIAHLGGRTEIFGGTRWAIVTTRPASYGMMRLLGQQAALIPIEVQLFGDPAAAEAWLRE